MQYLASPYSIDIKHVREIRYKMVLAHTAFLLREGMLVYSPILHCHNIAELEGLPTDANFWAKHNIEMLHRCEVLRVLKLDGWELSLGVKFEIAEAENLGMTIFYDEFLKYERREATGGVTPIKAEDIRFPKKET